MEGFIVCSSIISRCDTDLGLVIASAPLDMLLPLASPPVARIPPHPNLGLGLSLIRDGGRRARRGSLRTPTCLVEAAIAQEAV